MKDSVYYQRILEEGEVKGKAEEARRILVRQGHRRFGVPDPATAAAIESIDSTERIEVLLDRLIDVGSWEELLAASPEGE